MPNLGDCLDEAKSVITGERQDTYGDPEDCFELIGFFWENYLVYKYSDAATTIVSKKDVANMMILLKVARSTASDKRDNYVDICGYASIAADKFLKGE